MKHFLTLRNLTLLLIGLVAALLLVTAGGWSLGARDVWAFSYLVFVPVGVRIVLGLLAISSALLVIGRGRRFEATLEAGRVKIPLWVWLLLGGLIFWLFRERTWHGDALLKLEYLSNESLRTDPYIWKEPLDSLSAYSLTALYASLGLPPEFAVATLSVLAGIAYLWAVITMATTPFTERTYRILFGVGMLALGSSQLWFGHIENYSLVTAMTAVSMALAIGYLRGWAPLGAVGLTSGAAVSFHPQAVFALPALLVLLDRRQWPRQVATLFVSGLIVPVLTVAVLWLAGVPLFFGEGGYAGDPQLFWTLSQALAPSRLMDALNNLLLLVPLLPLWLVAGIAALLSPQIRRERVFRYLTLVALGFLIYHFFFQNDLPRHRDWDLFAIVGPAITAWGLYALLRFVQIARRSGQEHSWWEGMALLGLAIALLFSVSWVGVNYRYTLIDPNSDERELYQRYRVLDLATILDQATVYPPDPICAEAEGCERVALTDFLMPQDGDTRPTIFAHAPARIEFPVTVPEQESFLWLSPALDPEAWGWGGDGVTFVVAVKRDGGDDLLWSRHLTPESPDDLDWQQAFVPLDDYRGQSIILVLETTPGPAGDNAADRAGWGMPWLMEGTLDWRWEEGG
ncbi:MAG TPA: hypothetical protein EYP49_12020 [Anaerolineae bacterium]|nr:hypothetical protein [Anaerolineae bacterium]